MLQHQSFTDAMGFRIDNALLSVSITALLMTVFYAGPIVAFLGYLWLAARNARVNQSVAAANGHESQSTGTQPREIVVSPFALWVDILHCQWRDMRRYPEISVRMLVFAPVSEELIFRSVIIFLMLAAVPAEQTADSLRIALICPFWFAVAHIHHAFTLWKEERAPGWDSDQKRAVLRSIFVRTGVQLTYTTIFGVIAALLYLRTGSISAPITSHVICNYAQLPNMSFMRPPYGKTSTPRISTGDYTCLYQYRYALLVLHAGGLIAFSLFLFPWTRAMSQQSVLWREAGFEGFQR